MKIGGNGAIPAYGVNDLYNHFLIWKKIFQAAIEEYLRLSLSWFFELKSYMCLCDLKLCIFYGNYGCFDFNFAFRLLKGGLLSSSVIKLYHEEHGLPRYIPIPANFQVSFWQGNLHISAWTAWNNEKHFLFFY